VFLSHALLQEGRDPDAAEAALSDVLLLDPSNPEARHNLAVLRQQAQAAEGSPAGPATLRRRYYVACTTPSDIHEHLPLRYSLARRCRHVTEFGTRTGVSTTAFLYAQPEALDCYDLVELPQVEELRALAGRTAFVFHQAEVLAVDITETDLLFIDTWHVCEQLREELRLHAGKVRRYLVLHDTTTFEDQGETPGHRGLWPAVVELLAVGTFRLKQRCRNNNGLTILERTGPGPPQNLPAGRSA